MAIEEADPNSYVTFFYGPLHIDVPVLADHQKLIFISSRERWIIRANGERESAKSELSGRLDDYDDNDKIS